MAKPLIARLDHWLSVNRPDYYGHLHPGASKAQVKAFEAEIGLKLPDTFRQLYCWRNGHDESGYESLHDAWMFLSLEHNKHSKQLLDSMIGSDFKNPKWWRRAWVPFLGNAFGDFLCIDMAAEDGGAPGQVISFYHDDDPRSVEFPSLEAWLEDLVESMENGTLVLW